VEVVEGEPLLLHVVDARRPASRLTGRLHGWEQQADERADDRDHDEQLDECESLANGHGTPR
jgi:hypothetical protein